MYTIYILLLSSCGGYALIESAYLLNYGDGTAMLYVAFSSSKHRGSVLCYYEISELREAFRRIQSDCFYRGIGSAPDWVSGDQVACQDKQVKSSGRHVRVMFILYILFVWGFFFFFKEMRKGKIHVSYFCLLQGGSNLYTRSVF